MIEAIPANSGLIFFSLEKESTGPPTQGKEVNVTTTEPAKEDICALSVSNSNPAFAFETTAFISCLPTNPGPESSAQSIPKEKVNATKAEVKKAKKYTSKTSSKSAATANMKKQRRKLQQKEPLQDSDEEAEWKRLEDAEITYILTPFSPPRSCQQMVEQMNLLQSENPDTYHENIEYCRLHAQWQEQETKEWFSNLSSKEKEQAIQDRKEREKLPARGSQRVFRKSSRLY